MSDRIALPACGPAAATASTTSSGPQGQDFVVDVVLELDLGPAAASDDVADTVHYGELAERAGRGRRPASRST